MRDLVRLYATQLGKEQANWSRAAGRIPRLPGGIGEVDLPAGSHKLEATRHISGLTRPRSLGPAALCCCALHVLSGHRILRGVVSSLPVWH
jgi:hypothetical protein